MIFFAHGDPLKKLNQIFNAELNYNNKKIVYHVTFISS